MGQDHSFSSNRDPVVIEIIHPVAIETNHPAIIYITDLHSGAQSGDPRYKIERGVSFACVTEKIVPVTYSTVESYMIVKDANGELNDLEARFDIRSYRFDPRSCTMAYVSLDGLSGAALAAFPAL